MKEALKKSVLRALEDKTDASVLSTFHPNIRFMARRRWLCSRITTTAHQSLIRYGLRVGYDTAPPLASIVNTPFSREGASRVKKPSTRIS